MGEGEEKDETFRLLEWIDGTLRRDDAEAAAIMRQLGGSAPDRSAAAGSSYGDAVGSGIPAVDGMRQYTDAAFAAHIRRYYSADEVLRALADRLESGGSRARGKGSGK